MDTTFRTNLLLPASGYLLQTRDPSQMSHPKTLTLTVADTENLTEDKFFRLLGYYAA